MGVHHLVAGLIAEFAWGGGPGGSGLKHLVLTTALGVAGAIVGGVISTALGFGDVTGFNVHSIAIAVGGAIVVITAYRILTAGTSMRGI